MTSLKISERLPKASCLLSFGYSFRKKAFMVSMKGGGSVIATLSVRP